jgi:choline-glycine betaine transporter
MTMHPVVMLFLVFWGVGFGAVSVSALTRAMHTIDNLVEVATLPLAYVAITLAFGIEARKAERFVREILPARPPN